MRGPLPTCERRSASPRRAGATRGRRAVLLLLACLLGLAAEADSAMAGTAPAGFTDSVVIGGLTDPTAVRFARDGRVFVAEKSGLIKVYDGVSDRTPTVFADLRTNVHNFWDRGLLGLALDPDFPAKPYVYVLYTYDHVLGSSAPAPRWGRPGETSDGCPSPPGPTDGGCVVSGRLSRLQANGNVMTGPEHVLIEGWCQQFPSHSVGSLAFGRDGALYVSGGEGAAFDFLDYGQKGSPVNPCGDPPGGVGVTPAPPAAEGGALRAQDLRTPGDPVGLSGTVLRVDPATGAGLPDNPLAASPDANARRIVADGLRNPFRITVRPGTSDVWIGDVGLATFEEIDRIPSRPRAALDFGWPCYEGAGRLAIFDAADLAICENLYAQPGAVTAPVFTYAQSAKVAPGDPCPVGSSSISGLAFSVHGPYPAAYDGALFFADYSRRCIWVMKRGRDGLPSPTAVSTFVAAAANPVDLQMAPSGELYYVDLDGGTIHRVRFVRKPPAAPKPTPVIVGLGDSYSSGEANPRYDAGTDLPADRCHRSFLSWQRLVGISAADQLACSGARLRDLTTGQHAVAPDNVGQLERLRRRSTSKHIDWVPLTIGGNDLGFARILRDCLDPQTTCLPQSEQLQRRQLDALEPQLVTAYRSASTAAGGARVAVVGYPYLFPGVRSRYTGCGGMSRVEKVRIRRAQDLVEATLQRAAAAAGATFVSTLDALHGRELCTPHSWLSPIHVTAGGNAGDQQQAHPTACGQAAIARKVIAVLHLRRTVYGCDSSNQLRVVVLGDTDADGRAAPLRAVVSSSVHRRFRNIDVALTTILDPGPRSVTNVRVYDRRHFSADVDRSGSAAVGADRLWYSTTPGGIRRVASCSIRYGCRAPARSVPTRLAAVRLPGVRGAPRSRPRRFVRAQASGGDLEFLAVRWTRWGGGRAIGSGRLARCPRAPCAGRHVAVSLAASALILCPLGGRPSTVGFYHALHYRRRRGGLTGTFTIPQRDDRVGSCRALTAR